MIGSFINTVLDSLTVPLSIQQMMHVLLSLEPGIVRQTAAPSPNASAGTRGRHRRRRANFFPPGLRKEALDDAVDHSVPREGGRKPPHRRPWADPEAGEAGGDLPAKRPRRATSVGNAALVPSKRFSMTSTTRRRSPRQTRHDSEANCSDAEDSDGQGGDTDAPDEPRQELADSIPAAETVLYEPPGVTPRCPRTMAASLRKLVAARAKCGAAPATGSQWSTPPPHPDLGRFEVRCVRLSPARLGARQPMPRTSFYLPFSLVYSSPARHNPSGW